MNTNDKILSRISFGLGEIIAKYYKRDIIWCNNHSCYETGKTVGGWWQFQQTQWQQRRMYQRTPDSLTTNQQHGTEESTAKDLIISILKYKKHAEDELKSRAMIFQEANCSLLSIQCSFSCQLKQCSLCEINTICV